MRSMLARLMTQKQLKGLADELVKSKSVLFQYSSTHWAQLSGVICCPKKEEKNK